MGFLDFTKNAATSVVNFAGNTGGVSSVLKVFEKEDGAASLVSKTSSIFGDKLSLKGISNLSGAGFIAAQMKSGKTFEEAVVSLADVAGNIVEGTVEFAAGSTAGILDAFMKGIFGDNYLTYIKGSIIVVILIIILSIMLKISQILNIPNRSKN